MVSHVDDTTIVGNHTKIGALLLVTLVLGLSCANVSLRCGARFLDQSSSSSASEAMVRNEMSCDADAGYSSVSTFDRMRVMRKRASALESLVYSPGNVGKNPFSVTYSSSASTGYSQCTSSSLMSLGRPRWAADRLQDISNVMIGVHGGRHTSRQCKATRTLSFWSRWSTRRGQSASVTDASQDVATSQQPSPYTSTTGSSQLSAGRRSGQGQDIAGLQRRCPSKSPQWHSAIGPQMNRRPDHREASECQQMHVVWGNQWIHTSLDRAAIPKTRLSWVIDFFSTIVSGLLTYCS
jgi:hypothetical protein